MKNDATNIAVARKLDLLARTQRLPMRDVSRLSGIDYRRLCEIMRGNRVATLDELMDISNALGLDFSLTIRSRDPSVDKPIVHVTR